jgi:diaminopimelate decarboxylase
MTSPFHYKKDSLHIEGLALAGIADKYGTPVYCYSATRIEENYDAYAKALLRIMPGRDFTICYAAKANSNIAVLNILQKKGAGADIVSGGELARALKAGIKPGKIVFSGVGKGEEELTEAIKLNLLQINVESEPELLMISRISQKLKKKTRIAIRVNPDVDAKTHAKISTGKKEDKFGIDINLAPALYRKAKALPGIDASGVSVHIGSQLTTLNPYKRAYERVATLVNTLRRQGHKITRVDLGGGIGITYKNETPPDLNLYALLIRDIILPLDVHVILEPGRSIVGDAGVLVSRVRHVKEGHDKKFLIIDAAMNDLMRPALYEAYHPILPCKKTGKKSVYDIVGPVCETSDIFLAAEPFQPSVMGDLVAIACAGAYGASMSSTYNTRPLAPEVLVRGTKSALVRKAQKVKDLINLEKIPGGI